MTNLVFETARDFIEASKDLSYNEIRAYAGSIGVKGLRSKRKELEEKIATTLDGQKQEASPGAPPHPAKSPPKQQELQKTPPIRAKSPPKQTSQKAPLLRAKSPPKQTSQKAPPRPAKSPPRPAKSPPRPAKSPPRPAKSPPRPAKSLPKQASPKAPYHEVLGRALETGDPGQLKAYLKAYTPDLPSLDAAVSALQIEEAGLTVSKVVEVLYEYYIPLLQGKPSYGSGDSLSGVLGETGDKLARFLLAASLETDNTVALKVGIRIASAKIRESTTTWQLVIAEAMKEDAIHSFEASVRLGLLSMSQNRGEYGRKAAMVSLRDAMLKSTANVEQKRFYVFLVEEMILNNEIGYYSLEEFYRITKDRF